MMSIAGVAGAGLTVEANLVPALFAAISFSSCSRYVSLYLPGSNGPAEA